MRGPENPGLIPPAFRKRESIWSDPARGINQALNTQLTLNIPLIVLVYLNGGLFATRSAYTRFFIHEIAVR